MRRRAVVALEEVLGRDLPVGVELRLGPLEEARARRGRCPQLGDPLGHVVEELGERSCVGVGLTKTSGPQVSSCSGIEPELVGVDPALS